MNFELWNAFGDRDAPTPYGMWFDGDWAKPRLTDEGVWNIDFDVAIGDSMRESISLAFEID